MREDFINSPLDKSNQLRILAADQERIGFIGIVGLARLDPLRWATVGGSPSLHLGVNDLAITEVDEPPILDGSRTEPTHQARVCWELADVVAFLSVIAAGLNLIGIARTNNSWGGAILVHSHALPNTEKVNLASLSDDLDRGRSIHVSEEHIRYLRFAASNEIGDAGNKNDR
ncbi:hypothetical protein IE4771_PB00078 (plasmid) [Rhizobium etli bv. mimosae str. IE4771]|uniref:Uncharacterized protein n=1 Tax=Rhizobium etli bv. mimosae str. IE4771 TaxID=1432050 RepID=A0A060I7F5_RHIET|nr:hypothetical protein IE4771_PB00078 [Rhizobium sp. IE4771]